MKFYRFLQKLIIISYIKEIPANNCDPTIDCQNFYIDKYYWSIILDCTKFYFFNIYPVKQKR